MSRRTTLPDFSFLWYVIATSHPYSVIERMRNPLNGTLLTIPTLF